MMGYERYDDAADDLRDEYRAEIMAERRERARQMHWCDLCHGHPGCPENPYEWDDEPEPDEETDEENEE